MGEGFEGDNAHKMVQLLRIVKSMSVPRVTIGDWNNAPAQFRRTKWLKALKGELLLPTECDITCTSGKGRILDYGVCSRGLLPLIK
eukprot:3806492-Pyramimonas_sp.AAC.1